MTLRQMMARHAAGALTRVDHHGEAVDYIIGDAEVSVNVVVDRLDVEPGESSSRFVRFAAMVFIPTASLPAAVAPGHAIRLAMRLGDTPTIARITRIVSQDEGGVLVEVQT